MQVLGSAPPAPSTEEIIAVCGDSLRALMKEEIGDEVDSDRRFILLKIYKAYLYFRDLQSYAPALFESLLDATSIVGTATNTPNDLNGSNIYDWTQNIYRGYCRKLEAVIGNRMPNAIAVPDNPQDESAIRATESANAAALKIRFMCDLEAKCLYQVFSLFNYGTGFWHLDWEIDGQKYGTKPQESMSAGQAPLGDGGFNCPQCAATTPAADPSNPQPPANCPQCQSPLSMQNFQSPTIGDVPQKTITQVPNGQLNITFHDSTEVITVLDMEAIDQDTPWLRMERTCHKAKLMKLFGNKIKKNGEDSAYSQYAQSIRSAMASPIGLVRPVKDNQWVRADTWLNSDMYLMLSDADAQKMMTENFPQGCVITEVKGGIVDIKAEALHEHWDYCKPEPSNRIIGDPLGDDWIQAQDLYSNYLNQTSETLERSNQPMLVDVTRIDIQALQMHRTNPGEVIPAVRPAGGSLSDLMYQPEPVQISEQIAPFIQGIMDVAMQDSGLLEAIWGGGDAEEPTARQAELKKNAALMQLGVVWTQIRKCLERLYLKGCRILGQYEEGIQSFAKKNQFGTYSSLPITMSDLKDGKFHFEADEAVPMTWGQQRDLLMWFLDKPQELLQQFGMNDPLNIPEQKRLLGMPGERVPLLDDRQKCMGVIDELATSAPVPGPPDPTTGAPGPMQSSIQPDWEDNVQFNVACVKAYLIVNPTLKTENAQGYQNIQLYGQACEAKANQPPAPPVPKTSIAVSLKGPDLGTQAVQDLLDKEGLLDQGTQVQSEADRALQAGLLPNGQPPMPPPGMMAPTPPPA